jgi:WD40 repeat protein
MKINPIVAFSADGKYITAGSENQCVYLWRTHSDSTNLTARKDRNSYYEAIKGSQQFILKIGLLVYLSFQYFLVT